MCVIGRARALQSRCTTAHALYAQNTSGNAGRALGFRYLTVSPSLFVAKDQARSVIESIGVKTIVYSQINSSVGVMKKKKKKKKMEKIEVRLISVYNCSGVFLATLGVSLGTESFANHDHIPKKA